MLRYFLPSASQDTSMQNVDVAIYGATVAGIMAGIAARQRGLNAVIFNPGQHVGGMTTSGLGWTDFGNPSVVGGLAREFYRRLGQLRLGREEMLWTFHPSEAAAVLQEMMDAVALRVCHGFYVEEIAKDGARIVEARSTSGARVRARWFIDASYEGDLMASAGVNHVTGRESNGEFGESFNGFQLRDLNQFEFPVDPYIVPGHPGSGLLPGVHHDGPLPPTGRGDELVQAYNFRVCMARNPELAIPFPRPENYDERKYELLARYFEAGWRMDLRPDGTFTKFDDVGRGKTDTNNGGGFSSDYIGGNWGFPRASYGEREKIFQDHVAYQQGLLWFLQNSPRVPSSVARAIQAYGLAADEFTATGHWPPQLYIRECRRMRTAEVITERHCTGTVSGGFSAALGAYSMDSHNCQRVVVEGSVQNEGDVQVPLAAPYEIAFGAMVPDVADCTNLLVPVCLSATHVAYGSVRMEPVFMALGQAAGIATAICLHDGLTAQQLGERQLHPLLREAHMVFRLDQLKAEEQTNHVGNPSVPLLGELIEAHA